MDKSDVWISKWAKALQRKGLSRELSFELALVAYEDLILIEKREPETVNVNFIYLKWHRIEIAKHTISLYDGTPDELGTLSLDSRLFDLLDLVIGDMNEDKLKKIIAKKLYGYPLRDMDSLFWNKWVEDNKDLIGELLR